MKLNEKEKKYFRIMTVTGIIAIIFFSVAMKGQVKAARSSLEIGEAKESLYLSYKDKLQKVKKNDSNLMDITGESLQPGKLYRISGKIENIDFKDNSFFIEYIFQGNEIVYFTLPIEDIRKWNLTSGKRYDILFEVKSRKKYYDNTAYREINVVFAHNI